MDCSSRFRAPSDALLGEQREAVQGGRRPWAPGTGAGPPWTADRVRLRDFPVGTAQLQGTQASGGARARGYTPERLAAQAPAHAPRRHTGEGARLQPGTEK